MTEEKEAYLKNLTNTIEFDYENSTIIAPIGITVREVYVASKYDRRINDASRCWNPPIMAYINSDGYAVFELGTWKIIYKGIK